MKPYRTSTSTGGLGAASELYKRDQYDSNAFNLFTSIFMIFHQITPAISYHRGNATSSMTIPVGLQWLNPRRAVSVLMCALYSCRTAAVPRPEHNLGRIVGRC